MTKVFLSSSIGEARIPHQPLGQIPFGQAHYSWRIVRELYEAGFASVGMDVRDVKSPDIYQSPVAHKLLQVEADDVHVCVKPIEHIRPFFGIKNVFICGWEFPEFSSEAFNDNPMTNQIAVMSRADEVWCWSSYTARNLRNAGVPAAYHVAPPVLHDGIDQGRQPCDEVPLVRMIPRDTDEIEETLQDFLNDRADGDLFISVLNPYDQRKNLVALLTAFDEAVREKPNVFLLVKLVVDNVVTSVVNIMPLLDIHYDLRLSNRNVAFIGMQMSNRQMSTLYESADFYLSSSSAEGLNLPLIEAMSLGVLGISTQATAMWDYIEVQNAIVMPHQQATANETFSALGANLKLTHFPPTIAALRSAILKASALSPEHRRKISDKGRAKVAAEFGLEQFASRLSASFQRLVSK